MSQKTESLNELPATDSSAVNLPVSELDAVYPNPNATGLRARRAANAMWKNVQDDLDKLNAGNTNDEID